MPKGTIKAKIVAAREKAAAGVDYSPKNGAICPWCATKTKISTTRPWDGNVRVGYQRCQQPGCVIASLSLSIKSIEVDWIESYE